MRFWVVGFLFFGSWLARADIQVDPSLDAKQFLVESRSLGKEKRWEASLAYAQACVAKDSKSAECYFMIGVCQERLEDFDAAIGAYKKASELSPASGFAKGMAPVLPELEKTADAMSQQKYNFSSGGFFFRMSPSYTMDLSNQVGSSMKSATAVGFKFDAGFFEYKWASGTTGAIKAAPSGSNASDNPTYAVVAGPGSHSFWELDGGGMIPLNKVYSPSQIQWSIPLLMGVFEHSLSMPARSFSAFGLDFGAGVMASLYTKSTFVVDVGYIYHFGVSFGGLTESGYTAQVQNLSGGSASGATTGGEVVVGVTFLFGNKKAEGY